MKCIKQLFFLTLILCLVSCNSKTDCNKLLSETQKSLDSGNISKTRILADSIRINCPDNLLLLFKADSLAQIAERIGLDFSVNDEEILKHIEERIGKFSLAEKVAWEEKGWLEWRLLDGNKMYFNNAPSNLVLFQNFYEKSNEIEKKRAEDPDKILRLQHTGEVYKASGINYQPVIPVDIKITYTIKVAPGTVPSGETIRCWLPWPRLRRLKGVGCTGLDQTSYLVYGEREKPGYTCCINNHKCSPFPASGFSFYGSYHSDTWKISQNEEHE